MVAHVTGWPGPPPPTRNELLLQAEVARLRAVVNQISVLLDTSPFGPTRADLAVLVTEIHQLIDAAKETD